MPRQRKDPYAKERAAVQATLKGTPGEKFLAALMGDLKGEPGYTPVKGTDYFTAKEVESIKLDVLSRIPKPKDAKLDYDLIYEYVIEETAKAVRAAVSKIPKPKDGKPGKAAKVDEKALVRMVLKAMPKIDAKAASVDYLGIKQYIDKQLQAVPPKVIQQFTGGGATSLRQLRDVNLDNLEQDAQGNYILGGSGGGGGSDDQTAAEVPFTPAGNIAATDVQAAIEELDSEKATAAQGDLADSAVQPGDLADVATSGDYNDLSNTPDLSVYDEVEQYADLASFPATGDSTKFYLAQDTGIMYRWTGADYAVISAQLALGETSSTAYRGDRGKTAYDHSQITDGNPHGTTATDLGVEEGADVTDAGNVGAVNAAAASKTTPVNADSFPIVDSEASNVIKRLTLTNLKAFLKTYFDGLYRLVADERKSVSIQIQAAAEDLATGDGKAYFQVPAELNGWVLSAVRGGVVTAGTTGTTDFQVHNVTDAVDMLSTKLTIDSGETTSATAATAAVINSSNDEVATDDVLRIDVDAVASTAPQGAFITLTFSPS